MRRLLAIAALTITGFATTAGAAQFNQSHYVAASTPVVTTAVAQAGTISAELHQANFKFKKKGFRGSRFRSRSFNRFGHSRFNRFGRFRSRGFRSRGVRSRGFRSRGFRRH